MADDNYLGIKRRARLRGKPRTHEVFHYKVACIAPNKQTIKTYFIEARSEHLAWGDASQEFVTDFPGENINDYSLVVEMVESGEGQ